MSRIKGRDTKPEKSVRALLRRMGYRFTTYRKNLPGRPDVVLTKLHSVIFVHGCFWHGHAKCCRSSVPKTNKVFWVEKIQANRLRDKRNVAALKKMGWRVLQVWQCELKNVDKFHDKIDRFLKGAQMNRPNPEVSAKTDSLRKELDQLLENFTLELKSGNLRSKVLSLIPVFHKLRDMGQSLIPRSSAASARERILYYFKKYPYIVINSDELLVVSGIQEYARRIRELRVQFGWHIVNGKTAKEMAAVGEFPVQDVDVSGMGPDDYILLSEKNETEAAYRWNIANEVRRMDVSSRDKLLEFFKRNAGKPVTGEQLRYVAKDSTEWARRVRELRTEFGWSIVTKNHGHPDMPVGTYMLESLRQSPEHDRKIPDTVRGAVLGRDNWQCTKCNWSHEKWNPSDPRHLELHHMHEHVKGGANTADNLTTLCSICHDEVHRKKRN